MPTPKQSTQDIIQQLTELGIIKLHDPKTLQSLTIEDPQVQELISSLSNSIYTNVVSKINSHQPMAPL